MAATHRHHANDITGNSRRHCMMFYPSPKNPTFLKSSIMKRILCMVAMAHNKQRPTRRKRKLWQRYANVLKGCVWSPSKRME